MAVAVRSWRSRFLRERGLTKGAGTDASSMEAAGTVAVAAAAGTVLAGRWTGVSPWVAAWMAARATDGVSETCGVDVARAGWGTSGILFPQNVLFFAVGSSAMH